MPDSQLILHVKGTEDQTTELPRQVVRAAIAQGQITRSQLIWSSAHNAWKQVRELPDLLPSQRLAPAPSPRPRVATGALPKIGRQTGAVPRVASGTLPKIGHQTGAVPRMATGAIPNVTASPRVEATAASPSPSEAAPAQDEAPDYRVVHEDHAIKWVKWACIGVGVLILALAAANYLLVNRPLVSNLSQTPYAGVTTYAHLGGFMQPDALVIHIAPSSSVNASNIIDFLANLARSTPDAPLSGGSYERVSLTTGWVGQYSISGHAWRKLGDMTEEDQAQRKEYLLDQLGDGAGRPLVAPNPALDEATIQAQREKAWDAFVRNFSGS